MNIKTGLKTLAFAVPMAIAPLKSTAQTITKQAQKTVAEETLKLKGGVGIGYGVEPFFNKASAEPKIVGNIGFYTYNMNGQLKASVGQASQTFDLSVAYPVKFKNQKLSMDIGGHAKHHHISEGKDVSPVVLNKNLNEVNIPLYQGENSIGLFIEPKYAVNKNLTLSAKTEVGGYSLTEKGSIPNKACIISDDVVKDADPSGVVAKFGAGSDYNVVKNFNIEGNIGYSTLHKTPEFNLAGKFNF